MSDPKSEMVESWLARAEEDMQVAALLIERERRLLGAAVYHCQQAAEKSLKAWLTAQDRTFPKTHDLEALLSVCGGNEPSVWAGYREHARLLTPYATEFRYPGDRLEPDYADAVHALQLAREVNAFVAGKLMRGV